MASAGNTYDVDAFSGEIDPAFSDRALEAHLLDPTAWSERPREKLEDGQSRVFRIRALYEGNPIELMVKEFASSSSIKKMRDRQIGSGARRSWRIAQVLKQHRIGTPPPVAVLEQKSGARILQSYYISLFEPDLCSFRSELIRLYTEDPICRNLMNLLQSVADAVRAMHEAHVVHYDLGNQNILLRRHGDGEYGEVQIVDLNRARIVSSVTPKLCARDLSRIALPSDLLRVFKEMYFNARPAPSFQRHEKRFRKKYAVHSQTRKFRHPVRQRKQEIVDTTAVRYPDPKEIWIWDDRSGQPINVMSKADRNRAHSRSNAIRIGWSAIQAAIPVRRRYAVRLRNCFRHPVSLSGRIGVSVEPVAGHVDREVEWLSILGPLPALVRFYHHQGPAGWECAAQLVERLSGGGRQVSIALIQDRVAVREPARWDAFVRDVLRRVHGDVDWVEVGHAINRVKWGIWEMDEYRRLLEPFVSVKREYPALRLMGPAAIDFEYPQAIAALNRAPKAFRFHALSHHLYVDRRGAPEMPQGRYALLEKCALARAIAGWSRATEDRLIVTEVNWPLRGTGVYSPVVSPHDTPGPRSNDPSVSENAYGEYMIRYLLIALCSGMVERVYWWRLVSHGFGLIDDHDPDRWRPRPAFNMLSCLLNAIGDAMYLSMRQGSPTSYFYLFERTDGERMVVAYSTTDREAVSIPFACKGAFDAFGEAVSPAEASSLTGSPVYFHGVESIEVFERAQEDLTTRSRS